MLIDTHCHLDASDFNADRQAVIERSARQGVAAIVVPAIDVGNFEAVRDLAHSFEGGCYALGIHPICIKNATEDDLQRLERDIQSVLDDPRFVAIGEIGLDFFIPELAEDPWRDKQERFYASQLDLALKYDLPVLLHVRKSQDIILKHLRRRERIGGIAHAFNGSFQQAEQFVEQGFALGMGGAMTFTRAKQIRRLARQMPLESLVLETDAPDIPPSWLEIRARNEPGEVAGVAETLAELRELDPSQVLQATGANACRVLPRLASLMLTASA